MNTKAVAALLTIAAAGTLIGAAWFVSSSSSPSAGSSGVSERPGARPEFASADFFPSAASSSATPSPAQPFFASSGGEPIPARVRNEVRGWISMMGDLIGRMHEFDVDGDGMLSDMERLAMGMQLRKEFLAEYDLDGDGDLSGDEWRALQRSMFEKTPEGQRLMEQFDADGDGVLDEEEQAALDAHLEAQEQQRREEERARMDTDGDGEVSNEERRAARQQERAFWQNQMRTAENNFDYDGDGELNIEESRDAWDAWVEYQTVDDFINRYDSDGNRSMGPADYDAFLSDYERGSTRADVNNDGEVDVRDIHAFRDLVLRSRSVSD